MGRDKNIEDMRINEHWKERALKAETQLEIGRRAYSDLLVNSMNEIGAQRAQLADAKETCIEHARIQISLCKTIDKLEAQLEQKQAIAAIKWIQHDCPWDEETIRKHLEKDNEISESSEDT